MATAVPTSTIGTNEVAAQLISLGISVTRPQVLVDSSTAFLVESAIERHEGKLSNTGALCIETGKYTGRSPEDRFIVDTPDVHDDIAWGKVNKPMSVENYEKIKEAATEYLSGLDQIFVERCVAGAMRIYSRKFLVVCERASQALFAHQLLVRPAEERLDAYGFADFTLLAVPGLKLDPEVYGTHSEACVLINFQDHVIIVAGTGYSGEIKKSVFSTMNYLMPVQEGVLPMHSSCNVDPRDHTTAVFFGLSGTGKTTLSADPRRSLVGDDEHGWSDQGVFNFEGGCYAKAIRISPETEPEIYDAIRFGAVAENVVLNPESRIADYYDDTLTENTRVAYPIEHISNAQIAGFGGVPNVVIFLRHLPDGRRLWRPAPDLAPDHRGRHVPVRVRLHEQGRWHGAWHHRAPADLLHAFRRALHAAEPAALRRHVWRAHAGGRHPGLPYQYRLDRGPLRHG